MTDRIPLVAANWKMNLTISDSIKFLATFRQKMQVPPANVEVVLAPSFIALYPVVAALSDTEFKVGAQNLYWEPEGGFTGEISGPMLRDAEIEYVIVGHSERRQLFGETDEEVAKKLEASIQYGLKPILCVGETEAEREANETFDVLERQLKTALKKLAAFQAEVLTIAYEPVWAIGTGKTATAAQAQEVHSWIRNKVKERFSPDVSGHMRLLYGGSVKPENAEELMQQEDIDGALVGGASLDPDKFIEIITAAR